MSQTLTAYQCPACAARFALEADCCLPDPLHLHCPACGQREMSFNLLAPEELEAWELWHTLAAHLDRLPARLQAPLAEWELADSPTPRQQGLRKSTCGSCHRSAWRSPEAERCPACGKTEASLRRAG